MTPSNLPFMPYGEAKICLDCRAIYHRSLDACPGCGSQAWELIARVHGKGESGFKGTGKKGGRKGNADSFVGSRGL